MSGCFDRLGVAHSSLSLSFLSGCVQESYGAARDGPSGRVSPSLPPLPVCGRGLPLR